MNGFFLFVIGITAGLAFAVIIIHRNGGGNGGQLLPFIPKQPTPPNRIFVN
jgi:hypothetical protein